MPNEGAPGELAHARLELPIPPRIRRHAAAQISVLEASIAADDAGALMVTMRTEPATPGTWTLPLLAYLQFIGRFEDAAAEALTKHH